MPAKYLETLGSVPGSAHSAPGSKQGLNPMAWSYEVARV